MKASLRFTILLLVATAVAAALVIRRQQDSPEDRVGQTESAVAANGIDAPLPKLLELGSVRCVPCKRMAPILEALKSEYSGRMNVVFIDVWENRAAGSAYGIRSIPTQIFFDQDGRELFRHEGFFAKDEILAKWTDLGVSFKTP